jgi:hypothetical protein
LAHKEAEVLEVRDLKGVRDRKESLVLKVDKAGKAKEFKGSKDLEIKERKERELKDLLGVKGGRVFKVLLALEHKVIEVGKGLKALQDRLGFRDLKDAKETKVGKVLDL